MINCNDTNCTLEEVQMFDSRGELGINTGVTDKLEKITPQDQIQWSGERLLDTFIDPSFNPSRNIAFVKRIAIENFLSIDTGPFGDLFSASSRSPMRILYSRDFLAIIKKYTKYQEILKKSYFDTLRQDLTSLAQNYAFRRPSEVYDFLNDNVSLLPLLQEANREIRDYFPEENLILEVVADPEVDNIKELVVFIQTTINPDEALNKLEMLDENWWLDASLETFGKICIHLEFQ